jgi:NIMA (never in mitosis gene a)-related kinase
MKEINMRFMSQKEQEESLNEIRILASFRHMNITKYKEAFINDDKLYIITELVENGDLLAHIKKQKTFRKLFPEERIWSYFIQICLGLQFLHEKNGFLILPIHLQKEKKFFFSFFFFYYEVLHRDIKSANVFVTAEGVCKIGDMGVAKILATKDALARTAIGSVSVLF